MNADEQKSIIERFIRAYNDFDINGMVARMHPNCSFQNVSGQEVTASTTGLAEFRGLADRSKALFSTRCQKAVRYEFEGEKVTLGIAFEGVLRADLPNGMKAGDVLKLEGRSLYEFQDGLIYRLTDYS
jgi:hypothetical protein